MKKKIQKINSNILLCIFTIQRVQESAQTESAVKTQPKKKKLYTLLCTIICC